MKKKIHAPTKIFSYFLYRFGLTVLALLTLHVLVTIYKQIEQASLILNELTQSGVISIGYRNDILNKQPNHLSLPNYSDSEYDTKTPTKKQRLLGINPHPREKKGENFRTRFQESVFSYERRFYEADHTERPTYFVEMNRSLPRAQTGIRYRNTKNFGETEHMDKMRRMKKKSANNDNGMYNNNNIDDDNDSNQKKIMKNFSPSNVMIMAYRRSGSSFIGEMFNRNPSVFYLFEPIHPIEKIVGKGKYPLLYDTMVSHVLDVIYTCSFNKHPFLTGFLSKSAFLLKSEALKSGLCGVNAVPENMTRECKPLDQTILKRLCNSKDHIVVKSIRTTTKKISEHFSGFQTDSKSYKLNLIHLVRDPRAIISSRLYIFIRNSKNNNVIQLRDDQNFTNTLRRAVRVASANLCSRIHSDLKYGRMARSDHYMLLRYEDAAMRPLRIYEKISEFSRIKKSEVVEDWLKRNTRVASMRSENDEYSTSRNSTASINGWRRRMPYKLVEEVQSQCDEVMKILGYLPATSERELMDVAKSLVSYADKYITK